jgi:hypothetical protein
MAFELQKSSGDSMSFKEELERRKAQKVQAAQQQADQQQVAIAKIESRAAEVAQHLKRKAEGMDGLDIHHDGARVTISHKKSQERVFIDANTARYDLFRDEPRRDGEPPQTVRDSRRRVETLDDIDLYVLEFLERIGADWNRQWKTSASVCDWSGLDFERSLGAASPTIQAERSARANGRRWLVGYFE